MNLRWEVKDPQGYSHFVELENKTHEYLGHENLAHGWKNQQTKPMLIASLIRHIESTPEMGEWMGFAWLKI